MLKMYRTNISFLPRNVGLDRGYAANTVAVMDSIVPATVTKTLLPKDCQNILSLNT